MKTTKTYFLILFTVLLFTANQCQKEDLNGLPPETQSGKNTFGCYVDGELFVKAKGNPMANKPLIANYFRERKVLSITCDAANPDFFYIRLEINNPREGENNLLSFGYFSPRGTRVCPMFACENCGQVFITKLDTINRIVSGTFEFSGRCANYYPPEVRPIEYVGDSIVHITNGRFDIKLDIY